MVINPIVGVYIPIIRIPIKGGMTIPNTTSLDNGTNDSFFFAKSLFFVYHFGFSFRTSKIPDLTATQGSHLMFGWQKLFFQLAKGPKYRRVGLLLDGPGHAGCRLLSNPHRQPMGVITSSSWSPALGCRVAQAYVKPEYAKANKHVLLGLTT